MDDPAGMTILPAKLIGVETEPVKAVPTELVLDPSGSVVRIVTTGPAGTTTGLGGGGGGVGILSAAG